ncbi:MAG: hypothetical protein ABJE47_15890 [bacterium]
MTKPTLARTTVTRMWFMAFGIMFLAACGEVPSAPKAGLHPVEVSRALSGVVDGVYTLNINPALDQTMVLGPSHLDLPAGSICALGTSGYGPSFWDAPCKSESATVTITATVRNAATNHPSIQFAPALRFNPTTTVNLYVYVKDAATLSNMATVLYCGPFSNACVDESQTDVSLKTAINSASNLVSRRIKHFSGYMVSE